MLTFGTVHVFGVVEPLPLQGFPEGRVRIRLRHKEFGKVFVKSPDGLRAFYIVIKDGAWTPGVEIGANLKPKT